jgi:hypothetical protein
MRGRQRFEAACRLHQLPAKFAVKTLWLFAHIAVTHYQDDFQPPAAGRGEELIDVLSPPRVHGESFATIGHDGLDRGKDANDPHSQPGNLVQIVIHQPRPVVIHPEHLDVSLVIVHPGIVEPEVVRRQSALARPLLPARKRCQRCDREQQADHGQRACRSGAAHGSLGATYSAANV